MIWFGLFCFGLVCFPSFVVLGPGVRLVLLVPPHGWDGGVARGGAAHMASVS